MVKKHHTSRKPMPSVERLNELLSADFEAGLMFWKPRPLSMFPSERIAKSWNARWPGTEALANITPAGYKCGRVDYERYLAHRVIWKMATGEEPEELDHINRNPLDNRVVNLRAVTRSENNVNRRLSDFNTTGHRGVYKAARADGSASWIAQIKRNRKAVHLGAFLTIEEAVAARVGAEACLNNIDLLMSK